MSPLYTIVQDADPMEHDFLVVSINSTGAPGNLNRSVMKRAGYPEGVLPGETELRSGYHLIRRGLLKPVLFIVVNPDGAVAEQLHHNLYRGLLTYLADIAGRRVWLPLLGTGAGQLAYAESVAVTTRVIESLMGETSSEPPQFVISVPGTEEGLGLLKEHRVEPSKPYPDSKEPQEIGHSHWLIKMSPEQYEKAVEMGEHTQFWAKDIKEKRFAEGDYVLAFLTGIPGNYLWGQMEVVEQTEQTDWFGFHLKVTRVLHQPIPLHRFENYMPKGKFGRGSNQKDFIPISEDTYHAILALEEQPFTNNLRPFYLTEGNHRETHDQLGFEADIDAFAAIIRQTDVKPPLAIGLFGNWGSGKSFFMEKLEQRIAHPTDWNYPEYVHHVVPVRFNSWHYSDANLWASMIVHIFKSLNDYATQTLKGEKPEDAVKSIYEQLSITKGEIAAVDAKIKAKSAEVDALEAQKTVVEDALREQRATLAGWKASEVMRAVFSDPNIRRDMAALAAEMGTQPLADNIETMRARLDEMTAKTVEQKDAWSALVRNIRGKWILVVILAGLFAVLCFVVRGLFFDKLREMVGELTAASLALLGSLGVLWKWFDRGAKQVHRVYNRLDSLVKTVEQKKSEKELESETSKRNLEVSIHQLDAEKAALVQQKEAAVAAQIALETELRDISSGKRLADFLAHKTGDEQYARQLGIISWIREDLKSLNDHFDRQRKAREAGEVSDTPQLQIDRIVLYIDDLDRCNEDVVVKVLEAIHLLLAFPLFVVVVGVDPRWLNNALTVKYKTLFKAAAGADRRYGDHTDEDDPARGAATSYDYLEKIFQIPFALKPMTKTGREDLLRYLAQEGKAAANAEYEKSEEDVVVDTTSLPGNKGENRGTTVAQSGAETPLQTRENANEEGLATEETGKEKTVSTPRNPKEKLTITEDELAYMQQLSELFANTPRTANRYVNIYRLIKAHGALQVSGPYEIDEFAPILFLLAVIVGYPECADAFISQVHDAEGTNKCGDFLKNCDGRDIKPMLEKAKSVMGALETMEMRYLQKNLPLVARFSFRTLMRAMS